MQVFSLQHFERERVYTRDELFIKSVHLSAVNLHDWCPPSIYAPKISHVTENGQWLGVNKKGNHTSHIGSFESKWKEKKKKRNTTSNENNDGEIKLELMKIIIIATTVAMKTIVAKILSDNDNDNDTTNKKVTSVSTVWSGISLTHFICSSLHIHLRETYTKAIRFKDRFSVELGRSWYT